MIFTILIKIIINFSLKNKLPNSKRYKGKNKKDYNSNLKTKDYYLLKLKIIF